MFDVLKKIHWLPRVEIQTVREPVLCDNDCPWLELSEIIPGLFLTCEETISNLMEAQEKRVALILALNGEEHAAPYRLYEYSAEYERYIYTRVSSFGSFVSLLDDYTSRDIPEDAHLRKIFVRTIAAEDEASYDISRHFSELCMLIELVQIKRKGTRNDSVCCPAVAVHCLVGVSRSVAVVVAYVMKRGGYSKSDALAIVKRVRPIANPNVGFQEQLSQWERGGYYRVVDSLTASIVANELREDHEFHTFVEKQLPLIIRVGRLTFDREFFGLVLSDAGVDEETLRSALAKASDYIISSISDEVYVDVPRFFDNVCETIFSLICHAPTTLNYLTGTIDDCFEDVFYEKMIKSLSISGIAAYPSDVVKAFCSLLEAIGSKHLSRVSEKRPRFIKSGGEMVGVSPEELALTFPFLPFLAPYATGFVHEKELVRLGEKPTTEEIEKLHWDLLATFRENFLLTASGADACAGSTFAVSRWHAGSRFRYLEFDMEVQILESVEKGSSLSVAVSRYLDFDDLDPDVSLAWLRKLTGAVIGVRLFYDSADHYFFQHYEDMLFPTAVHPIAEQLVPWGEIHGILQRADAVYAQKCGNSPDLLGWMKKELDQLISSGMVVIPDS
ncbi:putative phopshatase [Trypanosoma grayi]|uniref:putative phopshatase n=1 Tax=Trypanosoma grayi TaxID=71804 RepID=UPI0004F3F81C|nr:putative phopshatase [Trypanosoma grayi]KEG14110.1 putative phopshatase [Trypanosoma grayi]